jgi:hypothetical protein
MQNIESGPYPTTNLGCTLPGNVDGRAAYRIAEQADQR